MSSRHDARDSADPKIHPSNPQAAPPKAAWVPPRSVIKFMTRLHVLLHRLSGGRAYVQVDLGGHRLLRDGRVLPVKPKAFELLAFLIRHPGQAFTRDQLLEKVWGYDYAGETRTVDVHVHWLRGQIEADPGHPAFIHTVRGIGYLFRRPA